MKTLTKLVFITSLVFTSTALVAAPKAAAPKSDNALVTACTAEIKQSFNDITNVKLSGIKSRRGLFRAKYRVYASGELSIVECSVTDQQLIALNCVRGDCDTDVIAAK